MGPCLAKPKATNEDDDAKAESTSAATSAAAATGEDGHSLPSLKTNKPAAAEDSTGSLYDVQLDTPKKEHNDDDDASKKMKKATTTKKNEKAVPSPSPAAVAAAAEAAATAAAAAAAAAAGETGRAGAAGDVGGNEEEKGGLVSVEIDPELLDGMMEAVSSVTAAAAASSSPTTPPPQPPAAAAAAVEEADVELVLEEKDEDVAGGEKEEVVEEKKKKEEKVVEEEAAADAESESEEETDPFPEKKAGGKTPEPKSKEEKQEPEAEAEEKSDAPEESKPEEEKEVEAKVEAKVEDEPEKDDVGGDKDGDAKSDSSGYESSAHSDDGADNDADADANGAGAERVVAATTPPQTSTKDANQSEVQGRAKDSPPPTPRLRGTPSGSPQLSPHYPSSRATNASGVPSSSRLGGGASGSSSSPTDGKEAIGWSSVVVLYTTSMSTVRKTAGQCQRVKQTLANLGVEFLERDISMAVAYKEELKKRLGLEEGKPAPEGADGPYGWVPVPYLFIDDESVAGGDDLDDMAAEGYLKELLLEKGRTSKKAATTACGGCGGKGLIICVKCHGSMRLVMMDAQRGTEVERRCPWCNEVGMSECEACVPKFARTTGKR